MSPKEQIPKIAEKSKEEPFINMAEFRAEIAILKSKVGKEEIAGSTELANINPSDLTLEDARMWRKHKSNLMTQEDVAENSLYDLDVKKDKKKYYYDSRENLLAFFRQVLTSSQLRKQQIEHENSINGNSKK